MKKFSDFNIKLDHATFVGDKIKINKIFNVPITVHAYKMVPSKVYKEDECLHLQIEYKEEMHVCFSGSTKLKEQIQKVPSTGFPFETTIVNDNGMHLFT